MSNDKKYVKISTDKLSKLIESRERLAALEEGGVDNWEWYGESFGNYAEERGYDDFDDYIDSVTSKENIAKEYEVYE